MTSLVKNNFLQVFLCVQASSRNHVEGPVANDTNFYDGGNFVLRFPD